MLYGHKWRQLNQTVHSDTYKWPRGEEVKASLLRLAQLAGLSPAALPGCLWFNPTNLLRSELWSKLLFCWEQSYAAPVAAGRVYIVIVCLWTSRGSCCTWWSGWTLTSCARRACTAQSGKVLCKHSLKCAINTPTLLPHSVCCRRPIRIPNSLSLALPANIGNGSTTNGSSRSMIRKDLAANDQMGLDYATHKPTSLIHPTAINTTVEMEAP